MFTKNYNAQMENRRQPLQSTYPSWNCIVRVAAASVVGALSFPCERVNAFNARIVGEPRSSCSLAEACHLPALLSEVDGTTMTTGIPERSTASAPFIPPCMFKSSGNFYPRENIEAYQIPSKARKSNKCDRDSSITIASVPRDADGGDANFCSRFVRRPMTRMQQLVSTFRWCLSDLGAMTNVTDLQLESYASIVYESMSAPSRTFHSVQHVFDISAGADPIQVIAALFHDVVYFTVDEGLPLGERGLLQGILVDVENEKTHRKFGSNDSIRLSDRDFEMEDPAIAMLMDIFGLERGQELDPFNGLNEFLSAAIAVKSLGNVMTPRLLAQITACIEATIPFRSIDGKGLSPYDHLFERLHKVNNKYRLEMDYEEVLLATHRSVDLANRDVQNFASSDPGAFIFKAWELLPESNFGLRHNTVFRMSSYSEAVGKMAGFFGSLDPSVVFRTFRQHTDDEGEDGVVARSVQRMTRRASRNMKIARTYMRAELLSSFVLGALAELTGGDAPMALFLGDSNPVGARLVESPSVEDYIVVGLPRCGVHIDSVAFDLLKEGRKELCEFVPEMVSYSSVEECGKTLKRLPLAAYLYAMLGDEGLDRALEVTRMTHPSDRESARRLLDTLPHETVSFVASACAKVACSRRKLLTRIAKEYTSTT